MMRAGTPSHVMPLTAQHPALRKLRKRHERVIRELVGKHKAARQFLKAVTVSSALLFSQPTTPKLPPGTVMEQLKPLGFRAPEETQIVLSETLKLLLPTEPGIIETTNAKQMSDMIWKLFGVHITQEMDGYRLNHSFGWIGYEQHLKRFPGDTLKAHETALEAGMAPGLGAWGYFAPSRIAMTPEIVLQERYYVAVQTLYTPQWNFMTYRQREWYKYRKVMVINPQNGRAIIADIADAGPAQWTGKQFGGSPALMAYLGIDRGLRKEKVLLWFVDGDPPLGPIEYQKQVGQPIEI